MKRTFLIKAISHLGLGAAIAAAPLMHATQSLAQDTVTTETADEVINGSQTNDPFSSENGAASFLELMQRINRGGQNWGEFIEGQSEDVDNAVSNYLTERAKRMKQQSNIPADEQSEEVAEEVGPQSTNPLPVYRALW